MPNNIETIIVQYLATKTGMPVSLSVPSPRPDEFITVERTGGAENRYSANAILAVQCWSDSRLHASALANRVSMLLGDAVSVLPLASCSVESNYHFPEVTPPRQERYQLTVTCIMSR